MNSGRALVLILLVGIAVVVAFAIFTFSDNAPIGPADPDDPDAIGDTEREAPDVVSTETVTVTGRVISRGNLKPVADAEVHIGDFTGRTKRDGRVTIEGVPVGKQTVRASAEGSLPLERKVEITKAATDLGDLLLPWPTVLTGKVIDVDAKPVAGASVRILERTQYEAGKWWRGPDEDQIRMGIEVLDEGKPIPGLRITTDASGVYRVEGLSAGKYFVSASADGHATGMKSEVSLPESGEATADISLGAASTIAGRVLDASDQGIDGAIVMITPWSNAAQVPYRIMERTKSTAGGKFRVDRLVDEEKYLVIARAPSGKVGIMIQIPAPKEDLVVKVGPRFNLKGLVTDKESGEVIQGARLWTILARSESGEDGRYELNGMVKHLFFKYVWIKANGYEEEQKELSFMERMGSDITKDFQLTKLKPGTLVVTVRDVNGAAIEGAAVTAKHWGEDTPIATGSTNEVGQVSLKGIFSTGVRVGAKKDGYVQAHLYTEPSGQQIAYPQEHTWTNVPPDETGELEIEMIATGTASGTVRDRQGQPLAGVSVETYSAKLGVTDAKGTFRVEGTPLGLRTLLRFKKPGYVPRGLQLEADVRDGLVVEMARGGTIVGVVVDDAGKPVGGVDVAASVEEMGTVKSVKSGPKGEFTLDGLEPGEYALTANRSGFAFTKVAGFLLAEAQTIEGVRIELSKGLKVSLKVYHPDGSEVGGTIYLHGPVDGPKGERILRRTRRRPGSALTLHLKPGRYQILASPAGDVEGAGAVDYEHVITSAGELKVVLSTTVLRLLIRAKVPEGSRIGSFSVTRTEPAEPDVNLWIGAQEDGSFRSPPLPPGKYQVQVWYENAEGGIWTYKVFPGLEPGGKVHDLDLTKK